MLNTLPVSVAAGILLGFLSGLGIGGGSLLILWLTMAVGLESGTAQTINLMFFLTAAGTVTLFRWHDGTLPFRQILPAAIAGCLSAGIFTLISQSIHPELLKKCFGVLLLFTGVRELFYRPRKDK